MPKGALWLLSDRFLRVGTGFTVNLILARVYGPEGFGEMTYVIAVASLFGALASFGLDDLVPRDLSAKDRGISKEEMLWTAIGVRAVTGGMTFLLFLGYFKWLEPGGVIGAFAAIYGLYFCLQPTDLVEFRLRVSGYFRSIVVIRSLCSLIAGGIKVALALAGFSLVSMAYGMLSEFGMAFIAFGAIAWRRRYLWGARWRGDYAQSLCRRAPALILFTFFSVLQNRTDALLVEASLGIPALGVYAAALRVMEVFDAIPMVFSMLMIPEFARSLDRVSPAIRGYRGCYGAFLLMLPAMALLYWIFPMAFGSSYARAQELLPYFALKPLAGMLGVVRLAILVAEERYRLIPLYTLAGSGLTALFFGILTPRMGLSGAALSRALGLMAAGVLVDLALNRRNLLWMLGVSTCVRSR